VRTLDILKVVEVLDVETTKILTFPELISASKDAKNSVSSEFIFLSFSFFFNSFVNSKIDLTNELI